MSSSGDVPATRRRMRDSAAPSQFGALGIKTVGILLKHASFDSADGLAAMRRPLETLATTLGQLDSLELFSEWSPPRDPPLVPVALAATANASAQRSTDFDASKALQDDLLAQWLSGPTKSAWWSVALAPAEGVAVSEVRVTFRASQLPDTVVLEVAKTGGSSPTWVPVASLTGKAIRELAVLEVPDGSPVATQVCLGGGGGD